MPLTPDQMDQLQSWMGEKDVDTTCPACGNTKWVSGEFVAPPVRARTGLSESPPQVPMVQLTCTNCGYIRLFSAVKVGLLD